MAGKSHIKIKIGERSKITQLPLTPLGFFFFCKNGSEFGSELQNFLCNKPTATTVKSAHNPAKMLNAC